MGTMLLHKVIISGGGTGGHIYPALAVAEEINLRYPNCEILFVGAKGRMEMEKVPNAGYPIEGLWISGFERKLLSKKNLQFPFKLFSSLRKSRQLLNTFKPQIAIGVGGFASGPLLYAASRRNLPTLIQEQNSFPGITNRILAKRVDCICTGFEKMEKWFPADRIVHTGNPLRRGIQDLTDKSDEGKRHFKLTQGGPIVFVMGGSLGAHSMNTAVQNALEDLKKANIQVIWQTGSRYFKSIESEIDLKAYPNISVVDFIGRMDLAYAASDLIVSRAGAMSIAELALVGKPTILVPSPNVAEDHQTRNAEALTKSNAAILLADKEVGTQFFASVTALLNNNEQRVTMSANMKSIARPKAAAAVVDQIEKLVKLSSRSK
jgi:UDP-N-acetylglucosamine--N-acetylmuramyl-(pentapeptide) pyrophosphoryl-undecaprenol N-acetylglucosamine transferase